MKFVRLASMRFTASLSTMHSYRHAALFGASKHCIATHPSDLAVALAALDAVIHVEGPSGERTIPFAQFHRLPGDAPDHETELERGEIIISIQVPASAMAGRSHYLKIRERASYEFALVSAAVGIDMQGPNIHDARIALGGVAPKPWRLRGAEQVLRGVALSDAAALRHALDIDFPHAKPGHRNGFKVELAKRIAAIRRSCVHRWAASVWWPLRSQWTSWRINSGWTRSNCG